VKREMVFLAGFALLRFAQTAAIAASDFAGSPNRVRGPGSSTWSQ
jgi:hypothetical protein